MSGIAGHPLVTIAVHENFGVYAYDVSDGAPRMLVGSDIQDDESREDVVDAILERVRAQVLNTLAAEDGDDR